MRKSMFGNGAPILVLSGSSFTPEYAQIDIEAKPISDNITRVAIDESKTVTTIIKGQWVQSKYTFIGMTKTGIDTLIADIDNVIRLIPHNDQLGISYYAVFEDIEIDDTDPQRVLVSVTLRSREYRDPGTYIEVLIPTGESIWSRGVGAITHDITWNANITGNVDIELWKGGVKDSDIATGETNDGTYTWTIPVGQTLGTDYQVKIISANDSLIYGISDEFRIAAYIP